jgi:hypothetical protein
MCDHGAAHWTRNGPHDLDGDVVAADHAAGARGRDRAASPDGNDARQEATCSGLDDMNFLKVKWSARWNWDSDVADRFRALSHIRVRSAGKGASQRMNRTKV